MQAGRHEKLLQFVSRRAFTSLHDAVEHLHASEATVRRDFARLAQQGLVERVRGGVRVLIASGDSAPFSIRQVQQSAQKHAIARVAAARIQPDQVLFIDGGTTTFHLVACLPDVPLRIITNSLRLASALEVLPPRRHVPQVFLTGGQLQRDAGLLIGPAAHDSLARYHADWAFLSVSGIDESGIYNSQETVVDSERLMIANAQRTVVMADHSKLGRRSMCRVCSLDEIDLLITDSQASPALVAAFGRCNLDCAVA